MKKPASIKLSSVIARPVRTREDGRWYWRAERDRASLGCTWATRDEAETWVAHLVVGVQERPDEPQLGTVVLLLGAWLAVQQERSDIEETTREGYRYACRQLAREQLGLRTVRVDRLNRVAVDGWVRSARASGLAETTIRQALMVLMAAWRWGRREGETPDRDLEVPKIRPERKRPKRTPTKAEIDAFLATLSGWVRVAIFLQVDTGGRTGEIASLTWADVDLVQGVVVLGRHARARKTGAREVPITREAAAELASLPRGLPTESVFGRAPVTVRKSMGTALLSANIGFTPTGFRRAMVDDMARSAVDIKVAAAWTGHSPAVMIDIYRTITEADKEAAMAKLGRTPAGLRVVK